MPALPQPSSGKSLLRAGLLLLTVVSLLAGCAGRPVSGGAPISRWTQLGAQDTISLRAIVAATDACPTAIVDGRTLPLLPRTGATPPNTPARNNPAFEPDFAVVTCELALPRSARQASIDGQAMPMPRTDTRRIVVIGDTGCRVKVPADSPGDPIQDCSSSADWPWQRIAVAAARTQPDLVIHLGDYHYREYCDQPALCSPLRDNGVVVGYDWAGWHADFFAPATPLLAAAAWVTVRGNHEGCDRGGEGWMRFLSPLPYQACPDQRFKTDSRSVLANNLTADAYRIDLGDKLALVVADNAGHEDYRPATPQEVEIFTRTLRALTTLPALPQAPPVWLLLHRPIWYDGLDAGSPPNALQTALAGKLPANLQFVFAGHQHAFQTINFAPAADPGHYPAGRPAQVVIGASGTQLEALDPQSPVYEGKVGSGGMERAQPDGRLYDGVTASSGIFLNRYSFLLLELDDSGWVGTLLDADGKTISHCRLNGERKEIACSFPGP
ncbi:MAG: metallophosphoesterase [Candidatus Accumulibacter sp.]|nr:metallophosphoesterase [Accumulibacter sp.]